MSPAAPALILYPVFAIFLLVSIVLLRMRSAWAYVALRCAHSYVHLTSNRVAVRFSLAFASNFALLVIWASVLIQLLRAGWLALGTHETR